jgi:DNA mismatch endonuclease (patch repair protein)
MPKYFSLSRSVLMSRIHSKDTRPELAVRSFLHRRGFRYALHRKDLPGTPDIVLPRHRSVVFVNGCLWHGHIPCSKYLPPRTRRDYWIPKIKANRRRDARQRRELRRLGWGVMIVWECQIDGGRMLEARLASLLAMKGSRRPGSSAFIPLFNRIVIARFEIGSIAKRLFRLCRRLRQRDSRGQGERVSSKIGFDMMAELRAP